MLGSLNPAGVFLLSFNVTAHLIARNPEYGTPEVTGLIVLQCDRAFDCAECAKGPEVHEHLTLLQCDRAFDCAECRGLPHRRAPQPRASM